MARSRTTIKRVSKIYWLPDDLTEEGEELVKDWAAQIEWDINSAKSMIVQLLEAINAHDEASKVNELLQAKPRLRRRK